MPAQINISEDDIAFAERVLLPEGMSFDEERRRYIRNLSTLDLQAVPGSGKTTALLAKLLILEKKLPFDDGSGILVISHTNAAVDEIKTRIEAHCPRLFKYPNFVGTIQSFVDEFLAIPCYLNNYKHKPIRIDNEIYEEKINTYKLPYGANNWVQRKAKPLEFLSKIRLDQDLNLIPEFNKKAEDFELRDNTKDTYKALKNMKMKMLSIGFLHFDDAYFLAEFYIKRVPKIIDILQRRFSIVFVDEMQDMDIHQYNLLEKLFYRENNSEVIFQRIGDKNQAIYNGTVKVDDTWTDRNTVLTLNGSHRLSQPLAEVVNCFALHRAEGFQVVGLRAGNLKPHIFIYEDSTKELVIKEFAKRIKLYQTNQLIPINSDNKFKALGWRKDHDDQTKFSLKTFFPQFQNNEHKPKIDYISLKDYLVFYDKTKRTLEPIRKSILNALLRILRYEDIFDTQGRYYTKRKLLSFLSDSDLNNGTNNYEVLKLNLYKWSIEIIKGNVDLVLASLRVYIPTFLQLFEKTINKSAAFISADSEIIPNHVQTSATKLPNTITYDGIEVEVTTVHSAKGQTHTASLYLETFYEGKYESERLSSQIKGKNFSSTQKHQKQAAIMGYVGLSRSTHLLGIAVHRDRFDAYLNDINIDKWEIIDVQN